MAEPTATKTDTANPESDSLIERARNIPPKTVYYLLTQAGGRCEYRGCNRYLLEHHVTGDLGNYGEKGHIYAFKPRGTRGNEAGRPEDIHHVSNLILLCHSCHKLIDDENPEAHPVELLIEHKLEHEERILALTGIAENRQTVPVVFKALVAGRNMQATKAEIQEAVAPNYPAFRERVVIDINPIPDFPDESYFQSGCSKIDSSCRRFDILDEEFGDELHLSVFAIAPIPLLMYLGSKLTDKGNVELFQRHRDPETWTWLEEEGRASYLVNRAQTQGDRIALLLNLSGKNTVEQVQEAIGSSAVVYEITLDNEAPSPLFLRSRRDLMQFRVVYEQCLAEIRVSHPSLTELHVFPAVPAPIALEAGRVRLPKIDPTFRIYDRDKRSGGFTFCMELT